MYPSSFLKHVLSVSDDEHGHEVSGNQSFLKHVLSVLSVYRASSSAGVTSKDLEDECEHADSSEDEAEADEGGCEQDVPALAHDVHGKCDEISAAFVREVHGECYGSFPFTAAELIGDNILLATPPVRAVPNGILKLMHSDNKSDFALIDPGPDGNCGANALAVLFYASREHAYHFDQISGRRRTDMSAMSFTGPALPADIIRRKLVETVTQQYDIPEYESNTFNPRRGNRFLEDHEVAVLCQAIHVNAFIIAQTTVARASGRRWKSVRSRPDGVQLSNKPLSDALRHKTNFEDEEFATFQISFLRPDHYVYDEDSGLYFVPTLRERGHTYIFYGYPENYKPTWPIVIFAITRDGNHFELLVRRTKTRGQLCCTFSMQEFHAIMQRHHTDVDLHSAFLLMDDAENRYIRTSTYTIQVRRDESVNVTQDGVETELDDYIWTPSEEEHERLLTLWRGTQCSNKRRK